jgi:hypothetical protein
MGKNPAVDIENDEFQCEACCRVCDIEDSVKFQGEYVCNYCGEDLLKHYNDKIDERLMKEEADKSG